MNKTKYWIINEDDPYVLWRQKEGQSVEIRGKLGDVWDVSSSTADTLEEDESVRQISEKEAKLIFPALF